MISLTGGNVQTLAGVAVPGGSLTLQLNSDAVVIATPGFVPSAYLATFKFDSTANLAGSCKIWSNFELNPPGTQYLVTFKDANGSRISNQIWQFTQSSGASVDIGTIIPVAPASSAAALPFSSVAANLLFGGPASGAAAFPTFRALVAADINGLSPTLAALAAASANIPNLNTQTIFQSAATILKIVDNNGGTRYSVPANGTSQATLNNTLITGGSTYGGTTQNKQIFTGNGTFTIPANVTSVKVTVVGGGGGGGGSTVANNGGGGGSGSVAIKWLSGLTPGNTLAITIGAAGAAGTTGASGGAGGGTSVASGTQTITSILTNGGAGGIGTLAASPGGSGGAATTGGDLNLGGTPGGFANSTNSIGGNGAPSILSGGGSGSGGVGAPGISFGDGGGGAGGAAAHSGGAGSAGAVIFEWIT